jgi:hypothetical protein
VLRDLFLFMCLVLARALRSVGGAPGAWLGRTLGRGHNGVHNSFLEAFFGHGSFAHGVALRWCWFNDAGCIEKELRSADVLIAHFGAHCGPLNEDRRCGVFDWPFVANAGGPFPATETGAAFKAADALRVFHTRRALVWMEYPAPHFGGGLGEYEDYWVRWHPNVSLTRPVTSGPKAACRPLGPCVSSLAAWRLSFRDLFHHARVPLLRTWAVSFARSEMHPGAAPAPDLGSAARQFFSELGGVRVRRRPRNALPLAHPPSSTAP